MPNLRNGYATSKLECNEKAREGDQGNVRRQKKVRTCIMQEIENKGTCYRNVSKTKRVVSSLRSCNIECFKSETYI